MEILRRAGRLVVYTPKDATLSRPKEPRRGWARIGQEGYYLPGRPVACDYGLP